MPYDEAHYFFSTTTPDFNDSIKKFLTTVFAVYPSFDLKLISTPDIESSKKTLTLIQDLKGSIAEMLETIKKHDFKGEQCVIYIFACSERRANRELPPVDEKFWKQVKDISDDKVEPVLKVVDHRIAIGGGRMFCRDTIKISPEEILPVLKKINEKHKITGLLYINHRSKPTQSYANFTINREVKEKNKILGHVLHTFQIDHKSIHDTIPQHLDLDEGFYSPFGGCEAVYRYAFKIWKEKDYEGPIFTRNIYELVSE